MYEESCLSGVHALLEDMSFMKTCLMGGHILQEGMSYSKTYEVQNVMHDNLSCVVLVNCNQLFVKVHTEIL